MDEFKIVMRGYDKDEVDLAIERFTKQVDKQKTTIDDLEETVAVLRENVSTLTSENKRYRDMEQMMLQTINGMQTITASIRKEIEQNMEVQIKAAQEEAKETIEDSQADAASILNEAQETADALITEAQEKANSMTANIALELGKIQEETKKSELELKAMKDEIARLHRYIDGNHMKAIQEHLEAVSRLAMEAFPSDEESLKTDSDELVAK